MRAADRAATLASVVVLTGVQGMSPALPQIQAAFGLDDARVSLLTVGYLLCAAFVAAPLAALADRFGERAVLVSALLVFGLAGGATALSSNFAMLVAARAVQGAAFGVVLAVTVAVTGRGADRDGLARAQSTRVVAMSSAEVVLPVAVGAVLLISDWRAASAAQLVAVGVAIVCAVAMPAGSAARARPVTARHGLTSALAALRTPFGAAVQAPGFARFLFKYAVLTYVPILAADQFAMSPLAIGTALGASALMSVLAAAVTPAVLRCTSIARATLAGLLLDGLTLGMLPIAPASGWLIALLIVAGAGDGVLGVLNNVSASLAAPADGRSAYFGLTGSIRNLGKFSAPAVVGGVALLAPVGAGLAVAAALGLAATGSVPVIARGDRRPDRE